MSQYDAAAAPMYGSFQKSAALTTFARREARVPLNEMNRIGAPGAAESAAMNFEEADLISEAALNEILWRSVRGAQAVMPPPVHAAFVRPMGWDPKSGKRTDPDGDER
jgi:hypothetical protein